MRNKISFKSHRTIYPYKLLWGYCKNAMEEFESSKTEYLGYHCMNVMLYSCFCMEAYLNYLVMMKYEEGWSENRFSNKNKLKGWREYERKASMEDKLEDIANKIHYKPDKGKRPFQTLKKMIQFRNAVVHAKVETLEENSLQPIDVITNPNKLPCTPKTEWEKLFTEEEAKWFYEDTEAMIRILHEKAELGEEPFDNIYSVTNWEGQP